MMVALPGTAGYMGAVLLTLVVVALADARTAAATEHFRLNHEKCGACEAVAHHLGVALRVPWYDKKHDVKIGSRLDKDGNFVDGKKFSYKTSELRAYEILEEACPYMQQYTRSTSGFKVNWKKNKPGEPDPLDLLNEAQQAELKRQRNELEVTCDQLVEVHEERLVEVLMQENAKEEVRKVLCYAASKWCLPIKYDPEQERLEKEEEERRREARREKRLARKAREAEAAAAAQLEAEAAAAAAAAEAAQAKPKKKKTKKKKGGKASQQKTEL